MYIVEDKIKLSFSFCFPFFCDTFLLDIVICRYDEFKFHQLPIYENAKCKRFFIN